MNNDQLTQAIKNYIIDNDFIIDYEPTETHIKHTFYVDNYEVSFILKYETKIRTVFEATNESPAEKEADYMPLGIWEVLVDLDDEPIELEEKHTDILQYQLYLKIVLGK